MEDYNTEIKVEHKQSESQRAMNSMQGTIVCVVIFGVIAYLVSYIYKYIFGKILFTFHNKVFSTVFIFIRYSF